MGRKVLALLVLAAAVAGLGGYKLATREPAAFIYPGVAGPEQRTVVPAAEPAQWTAYAGGGDSRLSVLLTDPESSWLGLAHGLKAAGIPFTITTDYRDSLRHRAILVYPRISGAVLASDALQALAAVPREGGTLIGVNVLGGGLQEVFGFREAVAARDRSRLIWQNGDEAPGNDRETVLPLGSADGTLDPVGTYAYEGSRHTPLARYDDGSAAIVGRAIGSGHAYAIGIDPGELLLKGQNFRAAALARSYVNDYEPALDVLMRFIARLYRQAEPRAVLLRPVPDGRDLAVVIGHDVDYTDSLANSLEYARIEREAGISATYFIQTKYMRDWNDRVILDEAGPGILSDLSAMGMELASHGVSHSLVFADFPLGSGDEAYPAYRPFVRSAATTLGGTILGELRVSRFLIEELSGAAPVVSFRPGHLANPEALPQALAATGYRYSSAVTANASLTHLPFRLKHHRGSTAEVPVYEFPVTIEDEHAPPLGGRLPEAIALARRIARHGGLCMVLIHPDVLGHKLDFERRFIEAVRDFSWFGTLADYGAWWAARDAVEIDVSAHGGELAVSVTAPAPVRDLTLDLPPGARLADVSGERARGLRTAGNRLIIDRLDGTREIALVVDEPKAASAIR